MNELFLIIIVLLEISQEEIKNIVHSKDFHTFLAKSSKIIEKVFILRKIILITKLDYEYSRIKFTRRFNRHRTGYRVN